MPQVGERYRVIQAFRTLAPVGTVATVTADNGNGLYTARLDDGTILGTDLSMLPPWWELVVEEETRVPRVGDLFKPRLQYRDERGGLTGFSIEQIIERGGADENTILVVTSVNDRGFCRLNVQGTDTEFSVFSNHYWDITRRFTPVDTAPSVELFVIWNESSKRFIGGGGPVTDALPYDQAVTLCRQMIDVNHTRILHIVPLRSVTKITATSFDDYRS